MHIRFALGLLVAAALAGHATAGKPADLPDNPPIVVKPIPCLPPCAWEEARSAEIQPVEPEATPYDITLTAAGDSLMKAALLLNIHPFLAFLPPETPKPVNLILWKSETPVPTSTCPYHPADNHCRQACGEVECRTVLENLVALEKAAECEEASNKKLDWGCLHNFQQCGMCQVSAVHDFVKRCEKNSCVEIALQKPITLHCENTPLAVVLDHVKQACGVEIEVVGKVASEKKVSVHAQHIPAGAVVEMVVRKCGCTPCVRGNAVCVCGEKDVKVSCEECCEGKCCCEKKGCCEKPCCKEGTCAKMCGGVECAECEKANAKLVKKQQKKAKKQISQDLAGIEAQVTGLLKGCYLAIEDERYEKAIDLARQALALDPVRVEGDPVVYKFNLIHAKESQRAIPTGTEPTQSTETKKVKVKKVKKAEKAEKVGKASEANHCVPTKPECACQEIRVKEVKTGTVTIGVGVNCDSGICGSLILNERNINIPSKPCCSKCVKCVAPEGSVFTKVVTTTGVECAKSAAVALAGAFAGNIPANDGKGCISLGLSSTGAVNVFVRSKPKNGVVTEAMMKDGLFFIWTKPAPETEKID